MWLQTRMFLLLGVLFGILYGVITGVGTWMEAGIESFGRGVARKEVGHRWSLK